MADATHDSKAPQYLSFTVGGTDCGFPILAVKEILQFEETTRIPGLPGSIRGVINVRGQVVPVLDLALRFGGGPTVPSTRTCVLVVEATIEDAPLVVGVLADAVNEVLDLPPSQIEPAPALGGGVRVDYVTGMGKVGRSFVLLLDVDRVLSAPDAALATQASSAAGAGLACAPA